MQRRLTAVAITAIALQCLIIFFASTRFSFFIGDDLGAAALMHHVDFWSFIAAPVDIHRVPLHRLVNYLLQTLFPMNFAAATAFMLACHAASLFVLYRLLQRINPSQLNLCLILAYALSGYVYIAMHWWSAALHRLPYILGAVISCYGFWRFHQQRRMAFAALTIGGQVIAAGFFVKAVLIPAYWAAMLFCVMNFRDWKKYRRDYALIACGATLSLAYMGWYVHDNHYNVIAVNNPGLILRTSLQLGFSTIAQMLLQMRLSTELAPWINLAFCLALGAAVLFAPRAWRAVAMAFLMLAINLLIIAGSSRATLFGPLVMFVTYYYAELLFLLVIFATLLWQPLRDKIKDRQRENKTQPPCRHKNLAVTASVVLCMLYAAAGWRTALLDTRPGPEEDHWNCARFVRNLRQDMEAIDIGNLNLLDRLLPDHFRYGMILRKPLPTSEFLSWFGWRPQYQQTDRPLQFIDVDGHIRPVVDRSQAVMLQTKSGEPAANCSEKSAPQQDLLFETPAPLTLKHGYLRINYETSLDTVVNAQLQTSTTSLGPLNMPFSVARKQLLIDVSNFGQLGPLVMTGIHLQIPVAGVCIRSIDAVPY